MNRELKKHITNWIDNKTVFEYNNYTIKNDTLYFKNIIKQPLVRLNDDGKVLINFHTKFNNQIKKIFKVLKDMDHIQDHILLTCYLFDEKEKMTLSEKIYDDFHNMIVVYSNDTVYNYFKKLDLDFKQYLINYMTYFQGENNIFDDVYNNEIYDNPDNLKSSGKLLGKHWDDSRWWGHWMNNTDDLIFTVQNEEIRNEIMVMKRTVKIRKFLKSLDDE